MKNQPPNRCLYCFTTDGPFRSREHPIPESLGNDDLFLEPGWVCDACNQYFGTKLERDILALPTFGIHRAASAVKTKKGKLPNIRIESGLVIHSTGYMDTLAISGDLGKFLYSDGDSHTFLIPSQNPREDFLTVRFLLKMGIGLLVKTDVDPYSSEFNDARQLARFGRSNGRWDYGCGIIRNRKDLIISERSDGIGPLVTHNLYEYSLGKMESGEIGLSFIYGVHVFAVFLTKSNVAEYVHGFNLMNTIQMNIHSGQSSHR